MALTGQQLYEEAMQTFRQGDYAAALAKFEGALVVFQGENRQLEQYELLNNMGVVYRLQQNWGKAIQALQAAIDGFIQLGNNSRLGQAWANLGDVHAAQRNYDEAMGCYGNASELLAAAEDREKQASVLRVMSLLEVRRGHWLAAMSLMEHSLRIRPHLAALEWLWRGLLRWALRLFGG